MAEEGEDATATQLTQGLFLFNRRLRKISMDGWEIPLITEEETVLPDGTSNLDLPGWTKLIKVQFLLGTVKFTIKIIDYNTFLEEAVITENSGIPTICYPLRTPTGITLKVFFDSNQDYTLFLSGYKTLIEATLETILDTTVEAFLQDYLTYQLAYDLQIFYQLTPSAFLIGQIKQYETKIQRLKVRRVDRVRHGLGDSGAGRSIAAYNLGGGWSP